jgi:small subunit ribosomal protein S7
VAENRGNRKVRVGTVTSDKMEKTITVSVVTVKQQVFTKLVNQVMWDGKKSLAERICYRAFEIIEQKMGKDPVEVFEQAMKNITPLVEVRARRVGGANYQVPVEVRPERRQTLAIRWLVNYARNRGEKTMAERLAGELMLYNGTLGIWLNLLRRNN